MAEITHIAGVPLEEYGDTMQIEGVVVGDGHKARTLYLPGKHRLGGYTSHTSEELTIDEAVAWLKQSDNPLLPIYSRKEQILAGAELERIVKAVYKKTEREVSRSVAWAVYRRDGFVCRYCGAEGVLTYDHVVPTALDGETTVENGAACCRSCNSKKGHKSPREWYDYMHEHPDRYPQDRVLGFHYMFLE